MCGLLPTRLTKGPRFTHTRTKLPFHAWSAHTSEKTGPNLARLLVEEDLPNHLQVIYFERALSSSHPRILAAATYNVSAAGVPGT